MGIVTGDGLTAMDFSAGGPTLIVPEPLRLLYVAVMVTLLPCDTLVTRPALTVATA